MEGSWSLQIENYRRIQSLQLIEDSTALFESYQNLQQENDNLRKKYELTQRQIHILDSEVIELRSQVCFLPNFFLIFF